MRKFTRRPDYITNLNQGHESKNQNNLMSAVGAKPDNDDCRHDRQPLHSFA